MAVAVRVLVYVLKRSHRRILLQFGSQPRKQIKSISSKKMEKEVTRHEFIATAARTDLLDIMVSNIRKELSSSKNHRPISIYILTGDAWETSEWERAVDLLVDLTENLQRLHINEGHVSIQFVRFGTNTASGTGLQNPRSLKDAHQLAL